VFSLVPRLSTRNCPHLLLSAVPVIDRYLLPAGRSAAVRRAMGQTDGRKDARPFHRHCCACYASSVNKITPTKNLRVQNVNVCHIEKKPIFLSAETSNVVNVTTDNTLITIVIVRVSEEGNKFGRVRPHVRFPSNFPT